MTNNQFTKRILIFIVILIGITILSAVSLDQLSMRSVEFNMSDKVQFITIYSSEGEEFNKDTSKKIESIDSTAHESTGISSPVVRIKQGNYFVVPGGRDISTDPIKVTVDESTTQIDINPPYTRSYLDINFSSEIPHIEESIRSTFPGIIDSYFIDQGKFHLLGDWYVTLLYPNSEEGGGVDLYGIIMNKSNDKWTVVTGPAIVFSYKENPDVPKEIIDTANQSINQFD